jgi:hypothetical protein
MKWGVNCGQTLAVVQISLDSEEECKCNTGGALSNPEPRGRHMVIHFKLYITQLSSAQVWYQPTSWKYTLTTTSFIMADYYTLAEGRNPPDPDLPWAWLYIGCPFASSSTAVQLRNGQGGGLGLLEDTQLIETLAHFSRERIPERHVSWLIDW